MRRLARAAAAADAGRTSRTPGGRPVTGLMEAVRNDLDALLALKAAGRTWGAIASALTAQGFTTADGRAIDQRNLTGIISTLRRRARREALRDAARRTRGDVGPVHARDDDDAGVPELTAAALPRPRLSPDFATAPAASGRPRLTQDERSRDALARARTLLKKD